MPARVVSTRNLPCELRFATPEAYEQLRQEAAAASLKPTPEAYEQLRQEEEAASSSSSSSAEAAGGDKGAGGSLGHRTSEAPSVHLFPEGGITNGRYGMMRFSRGKLMPRGMCLEFHGECRGC